jgi:type IV secretion system protein TrbE
MGIFSKIFGKKNTAETVAQSLPYQELYKDGTILTKDWSLFKCWHVVYPDVSLSPIQADEVTSAVAQAFHRKTDGQKDIKSSYWFCVHRVPLKMIVDPEVSGEVNMRGGDLEVEQHRIGFFSDATQSLVNMNYCCCKVAVKLNENGIDPESRRKADEVFMELEGAMRTAQAVITPLVCQNRDETLVKPEHNIMTFLKFVTNMDYRLYRCPENGMNEFSQFLSTMDLDKGKPIRYGDRFIQMLTINDFPSETYPGILAQVLTLPFQFRWTTRWIPNNNRESQDKAKKLRNQFRSSQKGWGAIMYEQSTGKESANIETQAVVDTGAMENVLVDLAHGETLGELTSTIMVWGDTPGEVRKKVQRVKEALNATGFDAIEETVYSNYQAWLSSLPGDSLSGRRRPLVTASNISHIVPFTSVYHGSDKDYYLQRLTGNGWPHLMGRLVTKELYYLNLNGPDDDIGHTFIVGSTGGGKSVLLALLGSQWARYPGSRVILFDKDQSFRNICQRSGGSIYIPGAEDSPLSFMPLSRIKTKPYEAKAWLELTIEAAGSQVTSQVAEQIAEVVEAWDDSTPTLERFIERLNGRHPDSPAIPALKRILDNELLARLFGGEADSFNNKSFGQKTMIEMNALMSMGDIAVFPALQFIFARMDELFDTDQKPTLLILDEAWLFLNHPTFRKKIKEWLKTLRKKRVFVVMAIQNINDIDDPEEFLTSCHTKIYLANPELKGEGAEAIREAYKRLGVTDSEIRLIGNARRKRDYFIQQAEGSALVDFCVDSYQLERIARDGK